MNLTKAEWRGFVIKERAIHVSGTQPCDEFCAGVGPVQMRITEKSGLVRVETTDETYQCGKFPIGKVIDALNTLFDDQALGGKEKSMTEDRARNCAYAIWQDLCDRRGFGLKGLEYEDLEGFEEIQSVHTRLILEGEQASG